ncbi:hypothetical protein PRIPAC_75085 [Pristionchus pacificus]|uniref:Uncharacterized protein n=1 Tax=Pristionchus pacificus TaxID=54126 RepID=A0A2A6BFL2_PRIPA|nr:hypothetical protein PRIPAC_75085 [Pristionchus pacificus]|eukprot:PDM64705.1 hypothetical protein PRIPAC_52961 [Pristionchus pacificus]
MQFLVAFLVILSISSAALYDYSASAAHERLDKKVALTKYCTNMCMDKCVTTKSKNGILTCAVPPCPELPCDSGCISRCVFAEKFLPHWLP